MQSRYIQFDICIALGCVAKQAHRFELSESVNFALTAFEVRNAILDESILGEGAR